MKQKIALVLIGAIILCFAGFNNKFPLLTNDTGVYIDSGFSRNVPFDRPVLYGLFIAHTSWGNSLWLVIFSQALILSLVLFYCFRYFSSSINGTLFFLPCLFFIAFFMSASVTASTVSAAVFSNIASLCMMLLLFAKNVSKRDLAIITIVFVLSLGMDIMNLITTFLVLVLYTLRCLWTKKEQMQDPIKTNPKQLLITGALLLSACALVSLIHFFLGAGLGIVRENKISMLPRLLNSMYAINKERYSRVSGNTLIGLCKWYEDEVREYYLSRQFQGWLSLNYLNYCKVISAILCLGLNLLLLLRKTFYRQRNLFFYIFIALIIQILTGALVYGRNNNIPGHLIWMLPIPLFIYLSEAPFISKWNKIGTNKIS
ncbi:hypothetical protein FAM09_03650 [Niastella caeni]|uniref:Glycosyltransferase family 39 protein n=1 Tax=Niastella caeni TaxID=2569763 RepID=A0A4S8I1W8_9BACT|nr:hypothetical protein [Niastella caeni]THU41219.1 hypothetical protein FAM09_03650 [Niastella caeni]